MKAQKEVAKIAERTLRIPMADSLKVGIAFDTRNDFKFDSNEPWDWDAEFQVSMAVDDIVRAIEDLGHKTVLIGSGRKLLDNFSKYEEEIDLIFNIAEGKFGRAREAQIPALLEMGQIPFVGSDTYTLSLAANKWHTKIIANYYGIRTPAFCVVENYELLDRESIPHYPVLAKLCHEGSSMGLDENSKLYDFSEVEKRVRYLVRTYKQPVLIEEFVAGTEVDVPIIGNYPTEVFGIVGISLDDKEMGERYLTSKIVYQDKYNFIYPLDGDFEPEAANMALSLYNILGCRDVGRVDMRIDKDGKPYVLEINPYCFLGKHSSFNVIAERTGIQYKGMIGLILNSAIERYKI